MVTVVRSSRSIACPWTVDPLVTATVVDESALTSVDLSWSGPGSTRSTAMVNPEPGGWRAQLALPRINGTWRWVITATDARGNAGTASGAIVVSGC